MPEGPLGLKRISELGPLVSPTPKECIERIEKELRSIGAYDISSISGGENKIFVDFKIKEDNKGRTHSSIILDGSCEPIEAILRLPRTVNETKQDWKLDRLKLEEAVNEVVNVNFRDVDIRGGISEGNGVRIRDADESSDDIIYLPHVEFTYNEKARVKPSRKELIMIIKEIKEVELDG